FYDGKIKHTLGGDEQGGTHAGEGYGGVSGKRGVVVVRSGGGGRNGIRGISDGYRECLGVVVFSGEVGRGGIGK
ncbi:thiamine pyrophosphate-binding protein, partial [Staphylococcus epidermidis]|uniref:thiamine pyrophosphate-binding protein n=1 Tax=Staphylococcus epidermidis TaxID=1282 RepID=UPI0021B1D177